jgi:predicted ester cyclase
MSMSREELERLDDQGIAAWNAHDADGFLGLFADEFVWSDWTLPEPMRDREGARRYFDSWAAAFPDMQLKVLDRVVGDDAVAGEVEFTGTNSGPLQMGGAEIPPTNRSVVGRGTYIARVRGGKVVEFSSHPDVAGMMTQLGFMPQT